MFFGYEAHSRPICRSRPTILSRYIHGGAWRDPADLSSTFEPTLSLLLKSSQLAYIAGFASINYRLSPYPSHLIDPSSNDDRARNAKHPDHIHDVLDALGFLQEKYEFGSQYVLVGHSAGATLAYQAIMATWRQQNSTSPAMPLGVVGLAGVYDFTGLEAHHPDEPSYREILENAFGPNWDHASPVYWLEKLGSLKATWPDGRLAIVAYSEDDELVEPEQSLAMWEGLTGSRNASATRRDELAKARGAHDQLWKEGTELANLITKAVDCLTEDLR